MLPDAQGNTLAALYHYTLSLFVESPFMTSQENLSDLFKKKRCLMDELRLKGLQHVQRWPELVPYIVYVFGVLYARDTHSEGDEQLLCFLLPRVLDKLHDVLLRQATGAKAHKAKAGNKGDHKDDDHKEGAGANGGGGGEEEAQDVALLMKQLVVVSIFLMTRCFDAEHAKYDGFKPAIAWTLSLVGTLAKALVAAPSLPLLGPSRCARCGCAATLTSRCPT